MPGNNENSFLYVRSSRPGRTQIGGTFCQEDSGLRAEYESLDPCKVQDISRVRKSVAGGVAVSTAIENLDISQRSLGKLKICLRTIALGQCLVFPPPAEDVQEWDGQ